MPDDDRSDGQYDVGGVLLPRPFKIRRFGHFGYNCADIVSMLDFYVDGLGLMVSDQSDRLASRQSAAVQASLNSDERILYFARFGTEHHQFVLIAEKLWEAVYPESVGRSVNQVTWQVGSLQEVVDANRWIRAGDHEVIRAGRDMPGSNWHAYIADADGHVHELYYGMEQIGWNGTSKPRAVWERDGAFDSPDLPHQPEAAELDDAELDGVDLRTGWRWTDDRPNTYAVDGVMLPRPFKVVGLGPVSLYTKDLDQAVEFHCDVLGFELRRSVQWGPHRGALLACSTDHHRLALYDDSLREVMGHADDRSAMALGFRVANYRQLRAAVRHLEQRGAELVDVPPELVPGFDYVAHLRDPEGNLVQLYYYMSQAAPDGPCPAVVTERVGNWPDVVPAPPGVFGGEIFLGPWH